MVITPLEGEPVTLPLTDMRDFRFSPENATGLLSLKASAVAGPKVSVCSGIVTVSGWDASRRATLSVYSVAGQQMLSIADWNGHDVDITSLPKGVYIIKIENQSTKIRK